MIKKRPTFAEKQKLNKDVSGPLPEGTVLISDAESQLLKTIDKETAKATNDPVLQEKIRQFLLQEEANKKDEISKLENSGRKPLEVETVDIEKLPPTQRDKISGILAQAKNFIEEESIFARTPQFKTESPDNYVKKPENAPAKPEVSKDTSDEAESVAGAKISQTHCQHCGWNLAVGDDKVESVDALLFVQAVLGGKPFVKEYDLLGGKIRITFRTLSTKLGEMCLRQCGFNALEGRSKTQDEFFVDLLNYRLVCGIQKIVIDKYEHEIAEAVDDFIDENKEELGKSTPLPRILEVVQAIAPLNQEIVWRQVGLAFQRFNKVTSAIEARADDPNFWQAIEDSR